MPERQVSLQELESKLGSYIHDVDNGATVVVSRDGRQVARIIPETDSAERKLAALKASGILDWSGRRPKNRRPSVRLRDGGSVSDIIISERR
ncbi:MAG: type II toxin-antitoxin system Phd/YefM family antitoxin [Acidobacteria bacterium]|nr:type II toxin-antitoxin system Phd/YefM family antitoxin [Acidobacteriota bacterium]